MKIAILNIATNNYKLFLDKLHAAAEKYFLPEVEKSYFVWSDVAEFNFKHDVKIIKIDPRGFPGDTLFRYHYFLMEEELLKEYDYLFYLDADMDVVDYVGEEVITDRLGVQHPGFWEEGTRHGTPENRVFEGGLKSTAFTEKSQISQYCCGGFNGGSSKEFLKMSRTIVSNINKDSDRGITAVWHDESHLNRYFADNPPTKVLNCGYCAPESAWNIPFPKKILALDKSVDDLKGRQ
jgi:hypothetical protein